MKNNTFAPLYLDEFDSPDDPGSGENMAPDFMEMLYQARLKAGIPFMINSGFRTVERNRKVGGKPNSSHLIGRAADVACSNSRHRAKMMMAFIDAGFTRIGIGETFLHVDNDKGKPDEVFWMY